MNVVHPAHYWLYLLPLGFLGGRLMLCRVADQAGHAISLRQRITDGISSLVSTPGQLPWSHTLISRWTSSKPFCTTQCISVKSLADCEVSRHSPQYCLYS